MKRFIIAALALLTIASTDPVADTRQIMAGTVTTKSIKNAYLSGARDTTAAFKGALSAYKAVRAAEPALTVKCADGTVIAAPGACPVAAPVPAPVPGPTAAYDLSIGASVDADGFAALPLRTGAHRYFVNSAGGSDGNGCLNAQRPASALATVKAGMACIADAAHGGDQMLLAEGTRYAEALPWLAFKGGFSAAFPTVISSYDPADPANEAKYGRGDQRNARPVLTAPQQLVSGGTFANIAIKGLDFNAGNNPNQGLELRGPGSYLLFENNLFRYQGLSYDAADGSTVAPTATHVIVRNNSFYGMWSTGGRTGGFYIAGVNGPTVEDNVFWHCGWKVGANRDDDLTLGGATVFSHSYYIQTNTTNALVRRNLSADGAGDGGIARGDSIFSENLFIDNPAAIGLGGGPSYNVDRPGGVLFDAGYNAIIGSASVPNGASGWAINTTNGLPGSRVHHNLIVRSANPLDPGGSGFSNNAAFNQPSYIQYDHNLIWKWIDKSLQPHSAWENCGPFPVQCHTVYDSNNWDGVPLGTNTNSAATVFPNPYTAAELYAALGFADKAAFIDFAINHPEAHVQRKARALLFAGYGMAP